MQRKPLLLKGKGMLKRLYYRLKNLPLFKKIILLNVLLLCLIMAFMAMYLFDYYPVVELKNRVFS